MTRQTFAPDTLLSMSGLDAMKAVLDGTLPAPSIGRTLNFWPTEIEEGRVVFEGTPTEAFTNPMGTLHGGWYGAILDSAMGCAVMTKVPKGSVYTTLEYKVNLIRAIPLGLQVTCPGWTDHAGRSTCVASAEIRDPKTDRLYATATSTCIIMKMAAE